MSWWAIAAQALGGALSSRSSRKDNDRQTKEERDFLARQSRFDAATRRAELEAARRWQLEDRRYNEEAIGGYRQYARPGLWSPEYSSTDPSRIEVPILEDEKDPKKPTRKQGLLG